MNVVVLYQLSERAQINLYIMIHSEELSRVNFKAIDEQLKGFYDVSYKNDLCDSVYCDELDILIYLPNSLVDDMNKELFNTFSVILNEQELKGDRIESNPFDSITDVIEFIKSNIKAN
jgi:hypothetical protein